MTLPDSPISVSPTRDPLGLAGDAPLFASWVRFMHALDTGDVVPFCIPGHKQRLNLTGPLVHGDVPLFAGLDTLQLSDGWLAAAESAAAALWGVDWCRFSVGGSTHANQAVALAVGRPGDTVIVSRTLHRSVLTGIILAGLTPVWVHPEVDAGTGLPTCVPVSAVEQALAAHPDTCAVMLGEPSYVGTTGDVAGHAQAAHAAGVPLIVDGAWAAHFGFHPALPAHALSLGADALVVSAHKTLPSMNQSALLLARTTASGGLLDPHRLETGFEAGHTTSPSGSILASIDAARALLARDGERRLGTLIELVAWARAELGAVPGVQIPAGTLGGARMEPTKLVIQLAGTGATGGAVERELRAAGITVEMAGRDTVIPMVTMADDAAAVTALVTAATAAIEKHRGPARSTQIAASWRVQPQQVMLPREAFFAAQQTVAADDAIGRVCAELVAPYPPGIPVLAPGELITSDAVAGLRQTRDDGGRIAYAKDPTLATFQVVR